MVTGKRALAIATVATGGCLAVTLAGCPIDVRILQVVVDASSNDSIDPALCKGITPPDEVITDFSSARVAGLQSISFGAGDTALGIFTYQSEGLSPAAYSLVSSDGTLATQALKVEVDSGIPPAGGSYAFLGIGLNFFAMCIDASAYSAIRFTIGGDLGDCPVSLRVPDPQDLSQPFGVCAPTACAPPMSLHLAPGTTTVPFDQLFGGQPLPGIDRTRITSVEWEYTVPVGLNRGCTASFTIDDVSFVP